MISPFAQSKLIGSLIVGIVDKKVNPFLRQLFEAPVSTSAKMGIPLMCILMCLRWLRTLRQLGTLNIGTSFIFSASFHFLMMASLAAFEIGPECSQRQFDLLHGFPLMYLRHRFPIAFLVSLDKGLGPRKLLLLYLFWPCE